MVNLLIKTFDENYKIAKGAIEVEKLNPHDPNIKKEIDDLPFVDSVKDAIYELLAESVIKENLLTAQDPDIKEKIGKLKLDENIKNKIYKILRIA